MSHSQSTVGSTPELSGDAFEWVRLLPEGAVSVEREEGKLVLRASQPLQQRFEELLQRRKSGTLAAEDLEQYDAICELDDALSLLNRLLRDRTTNGSSSDSGILPPDEWIKEFDRITESRKGGNRRMDDSRESIYGERGL